MLLFVNVFLSGNIEHSFAETIFFVVTYDLQRSLYGINIQLVYTCAQCFLEEEMDKNLMTLFYVKILKMVAKLHVYDIIITLRHFFLKLKIIRKLHQDSCTKYT